MNKALFVLSAYTLMMLGATVLMTKKENHAERFCVGDRNAG